MKSILQKNKECWLCGSTGGSGFNALHKHHVFYGTANRKLSEKDGLHVYLCGYTCHECGPKAVHRCEETDIKLKKYAQSVYEQTHTREEFMA